MNLNLLTEIRRQGLHQCELAQRAGVTESNLSRLIHGRPVPAKTAHQTKERLARALGVSVERLFPESA